ncbi:hypothetical protein NLJ89_g1841 [Agrocybe chaxingu]|uniref:PUL domain-containing protein n=1 Tax=Agrocybe chaxingu TaxID=84603 RepID=A0A9W8MZ95_9AGAR|nr:hypothetical protein NLJ89_g1841 [Agrocybe chaxingu]
MQRVALATILFNASVEGLRNALISSVRHQLVALVNKVLESETADAEAVYRTLVALGNIAYAAKANGAPLPAPQVGEISQCLQSLPKQFSDPRIHNVIAEIGALL